MSTRRKAALAMHQLAALTLSDIGKPVPATIYVTFDHAGDIYHANSDVADTVKNVCESGIFEYQLVRKIKYTVTLEDA